MFIKVCGLRELKHIDWADELGYTAVGVVLHPESPRYCSNETAMKMAEHARGRIKSVAVAVNYSDVKPVEDSFDYVQVYEEIVHDRLIYAGETVPKKLDFNYFLYDVSRGSGEFKGLPLELRKIESQLIIAGGLDSDNIQNIIKRFRPFGVDVSSGVESSRGIKDYNLMKKFILEVNNATG